MSNGNNTEFGFVLLHGAGLGAWVWDDVRRQIAYPSLAVEFPGRGQYASLSTKELPLEQYVQIIAEQVRSFKPRKLIFVAHSISGVLGLELVKLFTDRVVGFIALGASIPLKEGSFITSLPLANRIILRLVLRLAGTKPPESALRNGLCNDLDEQIASRVVQQFTPESKRLYIDRIQHPSHLPHRAYVRLTEDREFNAQIQAGMIANLQADEIIDLSSGHLPMLSRPGEMANILHRYAQERLGEVSEDLSVNVNR